MKKILSLLVLSAATCGVMAQQKKQLTADSILKKQLNFKADTNLFKNKLFSNKLPLGSDINLNQLNTPNGNVLASAINNKRITYDKLDNMPVLHTEGNSKMPVIGLPGRSNMPVIGKDSPKEVVIPKP